MNDSYTLTFKYTINLWQTKDIEYVIEFELVPSYSFHSPGTIYLSIFREFMN